MIKKFTELPKKLQNDEVLYYYEILSKKRLSLFAKRVFDIVVSLLLLVIISPILMIIAILIKTDSSGKVVFKQKRVTRYGKIFYIYKFRTMYEGSEKGSNVTLKNDNRITRIGMTLRKYRLDELLQLFNILKGDMSFVGTRPEVEKYVNCYSDEMLSTLLLLAGVTSLASIYYKDEASLLDAADDMDKIYEQKILPAKMYYNLKSIKNFSFWREMRTMLMTVLAVCGKEYTGDYVFEQEKEKVESI